MIAGELKLQVRLEIIEILWNYLDPLSAWCNYDDPYMEMSQAEGRGAESSKTPLPLQALEMTEGTVLKQMQPPRQKTWGIGFLLVPGRGGQAPSAFSAVKIPLTSEVGNLWYSVTSARQDQGMGLIAISMSFWESPFSENSDRHHLNSISFQSVEWPWARHFLSLSHICTTGYGDQGSRGT